MKDLKSFVAKIVSVMIALVGMMFIVIGTYLWVAVSSVGGAFAELGRDLKLIMKGKG